MVKKDVKVIYIIFNFCSWLIGATCRFATGLFSPVRNSPVYYRTVFDLHVSPVSYCLAIILVCGSAIFTVASLVSGDLVLLLLSLVFVAFNIALLYGRIKQKPAYYLPSLIALHTFFICDLLYTTIRTVALILGVDKAISRGYRSRDSLTVEAQLAQILYNQLVLVGLCIFGYISNIIYRDYDYIKNTQKPPTEPPSTPSASVTSKSDTESKDQNSAGIPHLYV